MSQVFVFGSNLAGIHGAGAAKAARLQWGAQIGVGRGRTGNAYAIPTKDEHLTTRALPDIENDVLDFIWYAQSNPGDTFLVTRVGCGLAGYTDEQIAPMFKGAPPNCKLPEGWR